MKSQIMKDKDIARVNYILEHPELDTSTKTSRLADLIGSLDRGMLPEILAELLVRVHNLEKSVK